MTRENRSGVLPRGRLVFGALALVIATAVITSQVVSDEKGQMPEMSPEEQKMMEAWMKASTPGEHHKKLASMVGTWEAKTKFWMKPGQPPEEGTGIAKWKSIFGGRFFVLDWDGKSEKMGPFQGFGISGYDNVAQKYVDVWMDSMGTGIMISWGTCDASGKIITSEGEYYDPMTGQKKKSRGVHRLISDTEMTFEMFDKDADGKEFKNMEIVYRKK